MSIEKTLNNTTVYSQQVHCFVVKGTHEYLFYIHTAEKKAKESNTDTVFASIVESDWSYITFTFIIVTFIIDVKDILPLNEDTK